MLGVLPCAGEGIRWGKITKELIPIGDNRWLVDNAIESMKYAGVDKICIVTLTSKIQILVEHFKKEKYSDCEIFYVIQKKENSMWEAIKESFPYAEDTTLFAMTDTLFNVYSFSNFISANSQASFALGTFETQIPERFGVLIEGKFHDKPINCAAGNYLAWGTMIWSKSVVQEWLQQNPSDYTDAINIAINKFGLHMFPLDYYYDFASWSDYEIWIHTAKKQMLNEPSLK